MQRAIKLAQDNYKEGGHAIAAIIVKDEQIIAEAYATVNKNQDPTCHAEINVIRLASKKLGSKVLNDCYLYSTFEPCPMCATACVWSKMQGIVYGTSREDTNEKYPQRINISCQEVIEKGNPKLELFSDFMREECKELLKLGLEQNE